MTTTMSDVAVKGLNVTVDSGIVRVKDGVDMWLCEEAAWSYALAKLDDKEASDDDEHGGEAYSTLCSAVRSPIASLNGSSRGHWRPLVVAAYAAELIDADDVAAYGL